ncbi:DUF92 domain-containing protein [Natronomonas sp.]|uniref:DUF92 domain-containing protein n=1 Tax=Natronomonas sp. TaxID=2184060 RepID=UPI00261E8762|nr:DUF92 domain-containing protein [Natronomonas sp.]
MNADTTRAIGYLLVGSLAFFAPLLTGRVGGIAADVGVVAPFALVAIVAFVSRDGTVFEFLASAADREEGRLYDLLSFALGATALALCFVGFAFPLTAFLAPIFVLTVGDLARTLARPWTRTPVAGAAVFTVSGTVGGSAAVALAGVVGGAVPGVPLVAFVAASGAVLGALIRSALFRRDDSLVLLASALVVWFLLEIGVAPTAERMAVGLAVTVALGYVAYALGTASVTGVLTGVLLALFAVVLGGYGWFVLLVTFFGLGGLASKYRYDEKLDRGIAQENDGARGGGNVLANSAVALVAVVAYAASSRVGVDPLVFQFVFSGAVAAALADTFSSEFGGLFDSPRLITTLEPVAAGTDGGVTWQGAIAGAIGASIIALLGALFFAFDGAATAAVVLAGFFGMLFDSVLGATLEGERVGNQGVNLLATLAAGLAAGVFAVAL